MSLLSLVGVALLAQTPAPAEAPAQPKVEADEDGRFPMEVRMGFGEGVTLRPPDGSFGLDLKARIQLRGTAEVNPQEEDEDDRLGFNAMVRRARVTIGGFALNKAVTFNIQLNFAPLDLEADAPVPLRDAYVTFHPSTAFNLRVGQMKVPFNRQRVNSSANLQFVDRSNVNGELNLDRDVGMQLYSTDLFGLDGLVNYNIGVFGGEGRNRLVFDPGLLYVARVQVNPFGTFDDIVEADIEREDKPRLAIGAVAAYSHRSQRERVTLGKFLSELAEVEEANIDYTHGAIDGIFKYKGFSVTGEAIVRAAVPGSSVEADGGFTRSAWGTFVQGGYMVTEHVEAVARYGHIEPLGEDVTGVPTAIESNDEVVGGLNVYVIGHDLKVQSDFTWLPDDESPEYVWRVQTQLAF